MTMPEVVEFIAGFADAIRGAGPHAHRRDRRSRPADDGYRVVTTAASCAAAAS